MLRIILFIALIGWALYRVSNFLLGRAPGQVKGKNRQGQTGQGARVDHDPNANRKGSRKKFDDAEYVDYKEVN